MSDFKAKMHQIRFRLIALPIAGLRDPTSKGKGRRGGGEGRSGREAKGGGWTHWSH